MKYSKNNDPSIASYLFLQFVERVVGLSVALCRMPTPSLPHYYNNIEEKKTNERANGIKTFRIGKLVGYSHRPSPNAIDLFNVSFEFSIFNL